MSQRGIRSFTFLDGLPLMLCSSDKRIKNFACVELRPQTKEVLIYLKANKIDSDKGFSRDVSKIGHFGTGDLEVRIKTYEDLEKAKPLIIKSYEMS